MMLRSSSTPNLCALSAEGDRHDSSPSSHCSSRAPLGINTRSRAVLPLKPSLPIRRACSEADLQSFLCNEGVTDHRHNAGGQVCHSKHQGSHQNGSIYIRKKDCSIISHTNQVSPSIRKGDFCDRSMVSCSLASCHFSNVRASRCLYPVKEVDNTGPFLTADEVASSSRAHGGLASSDGGFDGRDNNGNGHGLSNGPSGSSYGDSDLTDLRYRRLLQSDPQNPLLLRNYAQYYSETKHQHKKAEEYYERAILACPSDGEILSTYAKHVWDVHKDVERAGSYYEQAVKATPEDCYVLGSYAAFLWQSDADEVTNMAAQPSVRGTCTTLMASA